MTAYVILAAGRGTRIGRVGDNLPKCLVPLAGRAVLSHQIELRPSTSRIVVCVGYRGHQVMEYVALAHPDAGVEFTYVDDWDQPHAGPGASLLAARSFVGDDDMLFTSCDTLWEPDPLMTHDDVSWVGVAPIPAGTPPARWCRVTTTYWDRVDEVTHIIDKQPGYEDSLAYVGLGHVAQNDLELFWSGIEESVEVAGERQVSGGFTRLLDEGRSVRAIRTHWTDVGDESAYRQAVARMSGYDWTKLDQATYVLPGTGQVVKYHADHDVLLRRAKRGRDLHEVGAAARSIMGTTMLQVDYVPGVSAYQMIDAEPNDGRTTRALLNWVDATLRTPVSVDLLTITDRAMRFYRDKTLTRVELLAPELRMTALDAVSRIDWEALIESTIPVVWHGDLNFGNVVVTEDLQFFAIDWREDFAGELAWGDARYDVAKLLAGTVVHWDNARRGDFRPWDRGPLQAELIRATIPKFDAIDYEIIGALSLLNSAALHAPPLDEVLVARGCAWLEEVL